MLVLSRKKNESIVVAGDIVITVIEIRGDKVRLGIEAPREVPIHRSEVYASIHATTSESNPLPAGACLVASSDKVTGIDLPGCPSAVCSTLPGTALPATSDETPLVTTEIPSAVVKTKAPGGSKPRLVDLSQPNAVRVHVSRTSLGSEEAEFDADFAAEMDLDEFSAGILPD